MKTTVEKKPHSEMVVSGTLSVADIDSHYAVALDRFIKEVELPGFRKGKVPKERVLQEFGEKSIWREAAETALRDQIEAILTEHKLIPILPPSIVLTVGDAQKDVPFTITITTPPSVEIKDPKGIATAAVKKLEKLDREKERGEAKKSLKAQTRTMLQITEERDLTDEETKKLGFENAATLDHFLDGEAEKAVENFDDQRKRGAVAGALIETAKAEVPEVMIAEEARAMLESTKKNLADQNMPFNDYLEKRGMTETQVLDEMRPQAEKRVVLDLIFAHIAKEHEIKPDDAETHRIAHALMHQGVPDHSAHQYGAEVSIREQVWVELGVAEPKPLNGSQGEPSGDQSSADVAKEEKVKPEPAAHDHSH